MGSRLGSTTQAAFDLSSYQVVDLLAYYPLTDKVKLNLNIDNLFDEDYEERAWGNVWAYPGSPRTFQAGVYISL